MLMLSEETLPELPIQKASSESGGGGISAGWTVFLIMNSFVVGAIMYAVGFERGSKSSKPWRQS